MEVAKNEKLWKEKGWGGGEKREEAQATEAASKEEAKKMTQDQNVGRNGGGPMGDPENILESLA